MTLRFPSRPLFAIGALSFCTVLIAAAVAPQHLLKFLALPRERMDDNTPAGGADFVIARVRYTARNPGDSFHGRESWAHTYPQAEEHILQLATEVTGISLSWTSHVVVPLDSSELFQYPFAYITEPGEMNLTELEAANLREYLNRGGFVMVDDFNTQQSLDWFADQMRKVFPDRHFVSLKVNDPIFHAFYNTPTLHIEPPYRHAGGASPKFYGFYDEHGRLCMIINHDNNMGAFWVWLDQPMHPLKDSLESVRFGLNYILYSLTH